jgi:hypothetical protein
MRPNRTANERSGAATIDDARPSTYAALDHELVQFAQDRLAMTAGGDRALVQASGRGTKTDRAGRASSLP